MGGSGRDVLSDLTIVSVGAGPSIGGPGGLKGPGTSQERKYLDFVGTTNNIGDFPATEITLPGTQPGTGTDRDCAVHGIFLQTDALADKLKEANENAVEELDFEIPAPIFADGFESGDVSAWSYTSADFTEKRREGQGGDSELIGAKGGSSSSLPDIFTLGTTKRTDTNSDVQLTPWMIIDDELVPLTPLEFGGPANEVVGGLDVQGNKGILSFSEQLGPGGAFKPVIVHFDLDSILGISNPVFNILPGAETGQNTFAGQVMFDPSNPDRYIHLINGPSFPTGVPRPAGAGNNFAAAALTLERTQNGQDPIIDSEVFGGPGASSLQGLVPGIKDDYFLCGLTNVAEEDLEPPFERLSPATGPTGYDLVWTNCVRGRDGRLSRYYYRWGGPGDDFATACAVGHWGNPIIVGYTNGNGFPIVQGAVQSQFAGPPWDAVLVKAKKPLICAITDAASFRPDCIVPGGIISVFGHWVGHRKLTLFRLDSLLRFSTDLFGVQAYILGSDDQRYDCVPIAGFKSQTNIVVNERVPIGAARLCLIYKGVRSYYYDINIRPHWPACFTLGNNRGAIVAFPSGDINREGVVFPRGSVATAYITGAGPTKRSLAITETTPTDELFPLETPVGVFFRPAQSGQDTKDGAEVYGGGMVQGQTLFSGLAPGFTPGLQQVNFVVADDAPLGLVEVLFGVNGMMSDPVLMEVGP